MIYERKYRWWDLHDKEGEVYLATHRRTSYEVYKCYNITTKFSHYCVLVFDTKYEKDLTVIFIGMGKEIEYHMPKGSEIADIIAQIF